MGKITRLFAVISSRVNGSGIRSATMQKQITMKDVVNGNVDMTEVRFCVIKPMLDLDAHLRARVLAYLKWYHG